MIDDLLKIIGGYFPLEKRDAGEYASLKVGPMRFTVSHYDAKGFGKVSVMSCRGMMGLMKMDTVMVGPRELDAPFLSHDFIDAMGKETLILELYDLTLNGYPMPELDRFAGELENYGEYAPGPHWYDSLLLPQTIRKKGVKKDKGAFENAAARYFEAYMEKASAAPACDPAEKNGKVSAYCEGLLNNGGPAVDQFIKQFGKEKTGDFLRKVLFDTED